MTFVAQPYERFADDLLTALTGGTTREEWLFTGADTPYALAAPGVLDGSVRVYGQRDERFQLFEVGIDYGLAVVDAQSDRRAVQWLAGGRLPDQGSYFYVSYYRAEDQRTLSDRNPGSVISTLAAAFGRELAVLHRQMEGIYRSAFLDLAGGGALDHVVALLGLRRKDARFAGGEVVFRRSSPAPGDIAIPAGTLVSTDESQSFETTDQRTLRKGQLAVAVPIRAVREGPAGRAEAGAITTINRPIFGLESVVNEAATFFAGQKESDEELRRRMRGTLERAGRSTVEAIRYALIEDIDAITEANIQVSESPTVPGLVEVRLGLESPGDGDLVRRIEETIFAARPAGVRVVHNLPTRSAAGAPGGAGIGRAEASAHMAAEGAMVRAERLPAEAVSGMPEGVYDLQIELFLRLAEPNLSAAQKEAIEDEARATVLAYIEALPMGAPLRFNKLLGRVVLPDSVADAALLVGSAGGAHFLAPHANLDTEGRKARLSAARIFVGLMDEQVEITVTVLLEGQGGAPLEVAAVAPQLREGGAIYLAAEAAVAGQLAGARGELTHAALRAALQTALAQAQPPLQLAQANPVALSATYVESGRLLSATEAVPLQENELPRLKRLSLKLQDTLDV